MLGTQICGVDWSVGVWNGLVVVSIFLGSASAIKLVVDGDVHPFSEHCTRSDRVQRPVRGAASRNGCSAGCRNCCANHGGACDSEALRHFGEQCTS